MKVLDLQCGHGHVFEGWFASEEDFQGQRQRGLVECPACGDGRIEKRLSAPRLNLRNGSGVAGERDAPDTPRKAVASGEAGPSGASPALPAEMQAAWLELSRRVAAHTEDVGDRFADEARRIHHGEAHERAIRGKATARQAVELMEEGIDVLPLALSLAAKETLQ